MKRRREKELGSEFIPTVIFLFHRCPVKARDFTFPFIPVISYRPYPVALLFSTWDRADIIFRDSASWSKVPSYAKPLLPLPSVFELARRSNFSFFPSLFSRWKQRDRVSHSIRGSSFFLFPPRLLAFFLHSSRFAMKTRLCVFVTSYPIILAFDTNRLIHLVILFNFSF